MQGGPNLDCEKLLQQSLIPTHAGLDPLWGGSQKERFERGSPSSNGGLETSVGSKLLGLEEPMKTWLSGGRLKQQRAAAVVVDGMENQAETAHLNDRARSGRSPCPQVVSEPKPARNHHMFCPGPEAPQIQMSRDSA